MEIAEVSMWKTRVEAVKMIRDNYSNLDDYNDNEIVDILMGMGITTHIVSASSADETLLFYFGSFKHELREKLIALGKYSPEAINLVVDHSSDWIDLLKSHPPKRKSS